MPYGRGGGSYVPHRGESGGADYRRRPVEGGWRVSPELNPDVLETTASEIVFCFR